MATVTGFTASRMIALENSTVVGGTIAGDDLILQQHDGGTINAGNVRGPQGPAGRNGTNGATGQGWVPVEIGNAKNLDNTKLKIKNSRRFVYHETTKGNPKFVAPRKTRKKLTPLN